MTAKQLTRIGLFHIEEAILDTLFQAHGGYVRVADISRAKVIELTFVFNLGGWKLHETRI